MANTQSLHTLLDQTGWIHSLARRLVADPHLAADLAQDTTIDALQQLPDGDRPLRGWLATVMRNNLSKLRRGEHNRAHREQTERREGLEPAALDVVEKAETHRNVVQAVLALDEPYRSTLLMRFFEQLSYEEIARRTGGTRASVNSRITRGLERLRMRLENTYGGDRRALCLALTPLAKLPTGVALTTSTILGLKTMHVAIGTAAATLLAATVSVNTFSGGREPTEPTSLSATTAPSTSADERELSAPFAFEPVAQPVQSGRIALAQRQEREPRHQQHEDPNVWKTELFHVMALAPTVEGLSVNASSGDVEVIESLTGNVEIRAKVRAKLDSVKDFELTQIFEDHVDVLEEEGMLAIEDKHRNTSGWSVSFVVSVPGALPLNANSGSGDVTVRSAKSKVNANTGSGDVLVLLATERVDSLNANTGSGDVVVEVSSVENELNANTGSGDVTMRVAEAGSPGSARLNSGSGDVLLIVPGNVVGTFDLETHDEIEMPAELGIPVVKSIGGQQVAKGTVGGGGGNYRLRSGSGELRVELGNALPLKAR